MSKAAKQSIIILIILLLAAFGFAGITVIEKGNLGKAKTELQRQLDEFQLREKKHLIDNKNLQDKLKELETAKADLEDRLGKIDVDTEDLDKKIQELTSARDKWQKRVEVLSKEKEKLVGKLQEQSESQIIYKTVEADKGDALEEELDTAEKKAQRISAEVEDDAFWAGVLKEKATLELELEKITEDLTTTNVAVIELKKENSDLQLEISKLTNEKEAIGRDIKHANDLADSLSLELARARNDKKFLHDRVDKVFKENGILHGQIKRLTSTKIALEKSIVRLQDEKKGVQKKLLRTENVIQSRIDEIWEIKDSLDESLNSGKGGSSEIELPPIVVSAQEPEVSYNVSQSDIEKPGFDGNVVSVNENNNFVIVDIGQGDGIKLGDSLSVYRGAQYVAALEIIQLRENIAAADIKDKVTKLQVGDVVR